MAGSWNTLWIGFLISLLPIAFKKYNYIFFGIGYGLMSDSILYPILDLTYLKAGDWFILGLIPSIITIGFSIVFFIFSLILNKEIKL